MHILITGAAGMIGGKLAARLGRDGILSGRTIRRMTLIDVVAPQKPAGTSFEVETSTSDLAAPGGAAEAIAGRPDVIFHLAAIVSGEAETDFEKGYRVNFAGTRELLETIRLSGYRPKLVFASSIAVFGAPFPDAIPDDFFLTPLTSYGTQKAIGELLLADYTRRGFLDGIGIRLPSITVRPGLPNKAASGFFSSITASPWPATRRCCRCRRTCAIGSRARAPRSASSSTPPISTAANSVRASTSPCRASAAPSERNSLRSPAWRARRSPPASAASRTTWSRES